MELRWRILKRLEINISKVNLWNTREDAKEKKWNKGKSVQVQDFEDMYVKNHFRIYVLNPFWRRK